MGVGKCAQRFPERTGATDAKRRDGCPASDDLARSQYAYPKGLRHRWLKGVVRVSGHYSVLSTWRRAITRSLATGYGVLVGVTLLNGIKHILSSTLYISNLITDGQREPLKSRAGH